MEIIIILIEYTTINLNKIVQNHALVSFASVRNRYMSVFLSEKKNVSSDGINPDNFANPHAKTTYTSYICHLASQKCFEFFHVNRMRWSWYSICQRIQKCRQKRISMRSHQWTKTCICRHSVLPERQNWERMTPYQLWNTSSSSMYWLFPQVYTYTSKLANDWLSTMASSQTNAFTQMVNFY